MICLTSVRRLHRCFALILDQRQQRSARSLAVLWAGESDESVLVVAGQYAAARAAAVLLAFLVLLPWKLGRGHARYDKMTEADTSIGAAIKDGQFCLIAIAISVASMHEVLTVRGALPPWLVGTGVAQGC